MPTVEHDFLVQLFRNRPALAAELLALCAGLQLDGTHATDGSIDATQLGTAPFFADFVTVLSDDLGRVRGAIVVEVQRQPDEEKRWSWPIYVAATRATHRCPVVLLVITPDPGVASWAERPIDCGHPGLVLRPIVIGYNRIPRLIEAGIAPELAVLSALAHPQAEVVEAAGAAIDGLPEDTQRLYWDIILAELPDLVREALEATMENHKYRSEFARKYYDAGEQHGLEKGLAQGREQGREEGLRRAIVMVVGTRVPSLRGDLEGRLDALREPTLVHLLSALGDAGDEDHVRAVLERILGASG